MPFPLMQFSRLKFDRGTGASLAVLLVWTVAVSVPITLLTAGHVLPLPEPVRGDGQSAGDLRTNHGRWQAVHILVAGCPCSEFVANYLAGRGARRELDEQVWLVGGVATWEEPLKKSGFEVQHRDAESVAAQLGIQGGPWLRLIAPAGWVAYSGGYAPQR